MASDPLDYLDNAAALDEALCTALHTFYPGIAATLHAANGGQLVTNSNSSQSSFAADAVTDLEGTCSVHIVNLDCGVTDYSLWKRYAHLGALDAFVVQDPITHNPPPPVLEKGQKVAPPAPAATTLGVPPIGFVVFRDASSAYSAVERMTDAAVKKWDVVLTPNVAAFKTPIGCTHRGCRTLVCMLLHPTYHTQQDTADTVQALEDPQHAAQILCCSRFLSPGLAVLISRCPSLRRGVTREVLVTLMMEESSEAYITDSMALLAELHIKQYYPSEPIATLDAIVGQDIKLTKKVLRGLCTFVSRQHEYFDNINTQSTLVRIRSRHVEPDGKEAMIELCKLLRGNRPQPVEPAPVTVTKPPTIVQPAAAPPPTVVAPAAPPATTTTTTTTPPATAAVSSKQHCATCNGRAKFKCVQCEKNFCAECHKYDEQVHECLSRTVYVSKVDPALSDRELRLFLDQCGTVSKVRLCGDPSQRSVYGFIEFTAPTAAQKLLQLDRQTVGANVMRCLPARQPIHDHSDDDQVTGPKPKACQFGLTKHNSKKGSS